jgi:hypothetical protein
MMKRQTAGPALPDLLKSVGEAAPAKLVRSLGQLLDPLAEAPHVQLPWYLRQLLDPLAKAAYMQLAWELGQLPDPLAKASHVQLPWNLGQLLDAADASDGLAFTSGFVCRLRAHESSFGPSGCSIYRITIS